ncbi:hypothetical protein [Paenibacillus sp. GP183]|uniref:hypothetical protein n=1 Tax=Paenibacillus sp. GP183 TaxID=1882751 RepID=UPI00089509CE|nr:hypothetical protein [Paenibacillus sp. GP183]SEC45449.1 hypothetical protein SAMN05443246_4162 [Paenibacillus sp. GP183]
MEPQSYVLVYAPNGMGEKFIHLLENRGIPFAALVNCSSLRERMENLRINQIIQVDTKNHSKWVVPEIAVGSIYLFENSVSACCRYIQICRQWTTEPIYVITQSTHPRMIYKGLGANHVLYTNNDHVSFLLS